MKGIVFTEFLDFVEAQSGYETVDAILEIAAPPSGGGYTAVGNYHSSEMIALVAALAGISGTPVPELLRGFGRHLFARFTEIYPAFFINCRDPLDFIEAIESRIHTEVLKLYPDAELPQMKGLRIDRDCLSINYRSCRPLGQLCLGLIEGCGGFFKTELDIESSPAPGGLDITIRRASAHPASRPQTAEAAT